MKTHTIAPDYKGYRFPPEIISHAVWLSSTQTMPSWLEMTSDGAESREKALSALG